MKRRILAFLLFLCPLVGFAGDFQSGVEAYLSGDYAKALSVLLPLAQQGDDKAQGMLGALYAKGQGVPRDHSQAVSWYRKAAEQSNPGAQYMLGLSYYRGEGVVQDRAEAAVCFRKAAQQGFARAQYLLGLMYASLAEDGVLGDHSAAECWLRKAVAQGHTKARTMLEILQRKGLLLEKKPPQPQTLGSSLRPNNRN